MEVRKNQLHLIGFDAKKVNDKSKIGKEILKATAIKAAMNRFDCEGDSKKELRRLIKRVDGQQPIEKIFKEISRYF